MWSEAICADACWSVLLLCLIYMCGPDKTSTQGRCLFPHNEEQVMMGQREPRKRKEGMVRTPGGPNQEIVELESEADSHRTGLHISSIASRE